MIPLISESAVFFYQGRKEFTVPSCQTICTVTCIMAHTGGHRMLLSCSFQVGDCKYLICPVWDFSITLLWGELTGCLVNLRSWGVWEPPWENFEIWVLKSAFQCILSNHGFVLLLKKSNFTEKSIHVIYCVS